MKKHILVVSQYFFPEEFRINDICKEWVKKGYDVTVLTGIPNYPEGKYYQNYGLFKNRRQSYQGINIIRIPIIPRGNNSFFLILNYLSFVVSGFFWNIFTKVKTDGVFIFEVSPMTQALPGVWYSKKNKVPCYIYVQDLWPENVEIVLGLKNRFVINAIDRMVDYIYEKCTLIFTTSRSFVSAIVNRDVSSDKVIFWPQYAEEFYIPLKRESDLESLKDDDFRIVFTGNIGEAQGLEVLPQTALILKENRISNVKISIVGDGRSKEKLVNMISNLNVEEYFSFMEKQPAEKIPKILAVNDAAFLSFSDNTIFRWTIPAKLQSYFACGIPVLSSASGEAATIIEEANAGLNSKPGDADELAQNIISFMKLPESKRKTMGQSARNYYEQNFNKLDLLDEMDTYLFKNMEDKNV